MKGFPHATFSNLFKNLVMANGRADHTTPSRVQCSYAQCYARGVLKAINKSSRTFSPVRMNVEVVVRCESLHVATVGIHDIDLELLRIQPHWMYPSARKIRSCWAVSGESSDRVNCCARFWCASHCSSRNLV